MLPAVTYDSSRVTGTLVSWSLFSPRRRGAYVGADIEELAPPPRKLQLVEDLEEPVQIHSVKSSVHEDLAPHRAVLRRNEQVTVRAVDQHAVDEPVEDLQASRVAESVRRRRGVRGPGARWGGDPGTIYRIGVAKLPPSPGRFLQAPTEDQPGPSGEAPDCHRTSVRVLS